MITKARFAIIIIAVMFFLGLSGGVALAENDTSNFRIAAQPLAKGLLEVSGQTGVLIVAPGKLVDGKVAPAVEGDFSIEDVLQKLLADSGLSYKKGQGGYTIVKAEAEIDRGSSVRKKNTVDPEDSLILENIVVTATRRDTRLQDTPLSISAVSQDDLEMLGATDLQGYLRTLPGLSFTDSGGGRQEVVVRGVPNLGTNATTGLYVDETPVDLDLRLFDVERVEVLRGPQGTLYGAGTMGGAIRLITYKPDATEFSAKIDTTFSNTEKGEENHAVSGMINLPIVEEKLAVRVVAYRESESGFVDNYEVDRTDPLNPIVGNLIEENVGELTADGGRLAVRFTPGELLTLDVNYYVQDDHYDGLNTEEPALGPGALRQGRAFSEIHSQKTEQANFTLQYDFGWAHLISSTSKSWINAFDSRDTVSIFGPIVPGAEPVNLFGPTDDDKFTQEIRLASFGDGPFQWIVGGFYDDFRRSVGQQLIASGAEDLLGDIFAPGDELFGFDGSAKVREKAVYGELSYNMSNRLTGTVGFRAFEVDSSFTNIQRGLLNGLVTTVDSNASTDKDKNWKFLLSYQANDDLLFFAQAAQGYRAGGPNAFVPPTEGDIPDSYKPDSLWQYELGIKSSWLNNRFTANASLFYIDWTDLQTLVGTPSDFSFVDNFGKAHSEGVELDLGLYPVEGLVFDAQFSYTATAFDEDIPFVAGLPELGLRIEDGQRLPNIPRWTYSLAGQYERPLSNNLKGFGRLDWQYVGQREDDPALNNIPLDSYGLLNFRLGVEAETWELALFAKNLLDKRTAIGRTINLLQERTNYNRPRTIGVNLRKIF